MINTSTIIEEDCNILLGRALLDKTICAFGEDGLGRYGKHDRACWYTITAIEITIDVDDESAAMDITGTVALTLDGYDSDVHGHIMTDKNFEIRLHELLKAADINHDCLKWQKDESDQGIWTVVMDLDVNLLLDWA